jgi:hypothetical protein
MHSLSVYIAVLVRDTRGCGSNRRFDLWKRRDRNLESATDKIEKD